MAFPGDIREERLQGKRLPPKGLVKTDYLT